MDEGMMRLDREDVEEEYNKRGIDINSPRIETEDKPLKQFNDLEKIKEEFKKINPPNINQLFKKLIIYL